MTTQTKTTHTPGVWKVSSCSDGREIVSHSCGITFPIAEVCDGLGKANGLKEAQANARLIASAPELLEIAHAYRNLLKSMSQSTVATFNHIESVLAKAEGRI